MVCENSQRFKSSWMSSKQEKRKQNKLAPSTIWETRNKNRFVCGKINKWMLKKKKKYRTRMRNARRGLTECKKKQQQHTDTKNPPS